MRVDGEAAKGYRVIRRDSMEDVNYGELVSADEATGEVVFRDTPESTKAIKLDPMLIKILPRWR